MLKLGTFNLNNLFSRFNFKASISQLQSGSATMEFTFKSADDIQIRTFRGSLIKPKAASKVQKIAERIL